MAEQTAQIIDAEEDLQLTVVILAESAYVLTSIYQVSREVAVDYLISFF